MSCSACQKIFMGPVLLTPQTIQDTEKSSSQTLRPHHKDISGVCRAALTGCRICIDVWRHFFKEKTPEQYAAEPIFKNEGGAPNIYFSSGTSYRFCKAPDLLAGVPESDTFLLEFSLNSPMVRDLKDYVYIFYELKDFTPYDLPWEDAFLNKTSSGTMRMVRFDEAVYQRKRWNRVHQWISKCSSSHSICQALRCSPGFLPRRVLYAPYGPLPLNPHFILLDTSTHDVSMFGDAYLTLSHTWGEDKDPSYSTKKKNITERIEIGIPWLELPSTFQDTIDAARRLQVPFVWIDNLCIIQGDREDWGVESGKMAGIYMNSHLNLSATSVKSSRGGLTSSLELHPRVVQTAWSGERRPGWYRIIDQNFWRDRVSEAVLNTRGWVLQERALAPRLLHFCFDQLAWECCELVASEEFPDGLPSQLLDKDGSFKQSVRIGPSPSEERNESSMDDRSSQQAHNAWHRLVMKYGSCELTKPDQDKLVAISGLASAIQQQLNGDKYLAGLWSGNLYADLLWGVDRGRRFINGTTAAGMYSKRYADSERAREYRAPSWSWASVDGILRTQGYLDISGRPMDISNEMGEATSVLITPRSTILDAGTSPRDTTNPFGQVEGGRLVVQGRMYKLGYKSRGYGSNTEIFRSTGESVHTSVDEPVDWTTFDEAYFLPLLLRIYKWGVKSQNIQEMEERQLSMLSMEFLSVSSEGTMSERDWTSSEARRKADLSLLKSGNGYHDRVSGIVLCPSEDRQSFCRIGLMETSKRVVDRLDETAGIPFWEAESALSKANEACNPTRALTEGDVVMGVFEIV